MSPAFRFPLSSKQLFLLSVYSLVLFVAIFASACAPKAQNVSIKIISDVEKTENNAEYPGEFKPDRVVVKPGTTVTWSNADNKQHDVTSDGGLFNRKLPPGASFNYTFMDAGDFKYHCELFPDMTGDIVVE